MALSRWTGGWAASDRWMGRDELAGSAVRGARARPGPAGARPAGTRVRSGVDQDDGQEFSMLSRVSCVLWPVIQAVISFQKEPAPTAPGIWSEPSKRKTASGSCRISAESLSIGLTRLSTSQALVGADPAAARGGLGLLVGPHVGRTGRSGGPAPRAVGERRHELATAEDRLAEVLARWSAGRRRRRRRPRPRWCPRASWRRRSSPGGAWRTCRRGSAGRRPGTRWWRSTSRRRCRR